jgi:hypothetical protein
MFSLTRRPWVAFLLGLTVLAWIRPVARAQVWSNPGITLPQLNGLGSSLAVNPYGGLGNYGGAAALASLYANPYGAAGLANGAYGGYGTGYGQSPYGTYYEDPNGAILRGGAQVTDSQGRFLLYQQQAYWYREQVRSQRIANDRKRFDEALYEREKTPTAEDNRRRAQLQSAQRARTAPPVTEIWSGKSLNDLLVDLQKHPINGVATEDGNLPKSLDEDGLKHINVAKGAAGIGLLKNEGQLHWPVALAGSDYARLRERLGSLAQDAVRQAQFNARVDAGTIRQMVLELDGIRRQLRTEGQSLSASEYIESKGFLDHFADAIGTLRQTDIGNYFSGQYALKVNTVANLVKYMTEQGLQFAPALPGDRGAYLALHQALAAYGQSRQLQTAERKPSTPAEDSKGGTY